jgi:8-amino-3,8-dideoxy-alpha-D-manno-octulosonate transaminase
VTFVATVAAVVAQRGVPVFAEVDDSLNLDPEDFAAKVTHRTKAAIPVHLGNVPADMDPIMTAARERGVAVLEDAAQAAGVRYRGRRVGSIGDMGAFSLQLEKNITSGEGGVVTTNDWPLHDRAARYQDQGGQFTTQTGEVRGTESGEAFLGENLRMTEIAGAIAGVKLRRLDGMLDALRANKRRVKERLLDLGGVQFRRLPDPNGEGASHLIFYVEDRELAGRVVQALRAEGIPAGQFYSGQPVYLNPAVLNQATPVDWGCPFQCPSYPTDVKYYEGLCPRSEDLLGRHVAVGIGPAWSEADCDDVVTAVRKVASHLIG